MYAKQVTIFLENEKGRLAEVTRLLAQERINIRALSLAEIPDVGVLRMIVDDRGRCLQLLRSQGFVVQETEVIAVEIDDKPGGLNHIVEILGREGINIEYMYSFFMKNVDAAVVVFKTGAADQTIEVLSKCGVSVLSEDRLKKFF